MKGLVLFVALLRASLLPGYGQAVSGPVVLRDTLRAYPLGWHWQLLADERPDAYTHPLTLAQVQAPVYSRQFRPSTQAIPNTDHRQADYWLRCQVRNDGAASTAWALISIAPAGSSFEAYLLAPDGSVRRYEGSPDIDPARYAASHAVPIRYANLNLPLRPGLTYTLYVHTWAGVFNYSIYERTHLLQVHRSFDAGSFLYFGVLLAMVGYNFLLLLLVRDRSYLYYVLFTAAFGLLQANFMGYTHGWEQRVLPPIIADLSQHILLGIVIALSIFTARAFLETPRLAPRLDRLMLAALLLAPLPALAAWLDESGTFRFLPIAAPLLDGAVLLVVGIQQLVAGSRPARYYMAGWSLLIIAITVYYLRVLNVLPVSFITENGTRIASAIEVLLLSVGLADRINRARREQHIAQAQALAALQEKDEVQQRANEDLSQRAQELEAAYADLQASLRTTGRLQELDELKTRFFTNISHELRTPLTLILGPLEELMAGTTRPDWPTLLERHTLMRRHAGRLLELINQLLDIARLEAGQLRLHAAPLDLTAFVRDSVAAFDSLAVVQGLRLWASLPSVEIPAYADRDQLEKVLTNLLGNALKFTPAGGKVQVALAVEGEEAVLTVADTGPGIPAAHLPLIFDRFHQVDDSTRRRHSGSGIGLALVRELVQLHHGTVTVASTEGMGATFTVRLPLGKAHLKPEELAPLNTEEAATKQEEATAERVAHLAFDEVESTNESATLAKASADNAAIFDSARSEEPDNRPLVLVVDDHADMRAYVADCLRPEFRVLTAEEGEAGLARITEEVPDLVVSDLMMPILDGLELCRRLKTDERTSHIPVVLLTARATADSRLEGLELGADDYLTKPFRPQELRARVRNLLRQRELLRQRFGREVAVQPRDLAITSADTVFLNKAVALVEQHLANTDFDVEQFAEQLNMSRVQLYRKLKALTDQSPTDFVRTLRLRRAAQLLAAQAGTVADVAYQVGFNNLSYFSKCFREEFGHVPSEHAASVV